MKKFILIAILSMFLVGCGDNPDEIIKHTSDGIKQVDKMLWLVNQQVKYPEQDEFSLRSAVEYKDAKIVKSGRELLPNEGNVEYKEQKVYSTPLGLISKDLNYSDNDYVVLMTFKSSYWTNDHPESVINVCNYTLKKLNKEGLLYGFNVNNINIIKRNKKGMNDPINFDNICHNYIENKENTFYIAMIVK